MKNVYEVFTFATVFAIIAITIVEVGAYVLCMGVTITASASPGLTTKVAVYSSNYTVEGTVSRSIFSAARYKRKSNSSRNNNYSLQFASPTRLSWTPWARQPVKCVALAVKVKQTTREQPSGRFTRTRPALYPK